MAPIDPPYRPNPQALGWLQVAAGPVLALALWTAGCATSFAPDAPIQGLLDGVSHIDEFGRSPKNNNQPDGYGPESCDAGPFPPEPPPKCSAGGCADGNPCTQDLCDPQNGCYFPPQNEGAPCSDNHACTTGSTCLQGQCGSAAIGPVDVGAGSWAEPLAMADGGAVIIGSSGAGVNQPQKLWTRRVAPDGALLWNRDWQIGMGSSKLAKAVSAPKEGVFIAGTSTYTSTSTYDDTGRRPWLARLDAAGDVLWELQAPDLPGSVVTAITVGDGQLVLLVQGGSESPNNRLLRATAEGQWLPPVVLPNAVTAAVVALSAESTNTVLVLARTYHIEGNAMVDDDVVVWRLDVSGKLLSTYTWPQQWLGSPTAFAADGTGFWMAGQLAGPNWTWRPFVSRFDPAGKQLWRQVIADSGGYSFISLALLANGGVASLVSRSGAGPIWPVLSHYSSAGAVTWRGQPTATLTRPDGFTARTGGWMWCDRAVPGNSPSRVRWVRASAWGHDDCAAAGECLTKDLQDCPGGDACSGPQCSPATGCLAAGANVSPALQCDDGNPCTVETCDASSGCVHSKAAFGSPCNDDNVCTSGDYCAAGLCIAKTTANCNDSNPCTQDSCQPQNGCQFKLLPEGTACDDGLPCTVGAECLLGKCGAPALWHRGLLQSETGSVVGLFAGPADGLIAVGQSSAGGAATRPVAIGVSAGGSVLWTRSGGPQAGLKLSAAILLKDGTLLAVGANSAGTDGQNSDVALVRWLPGGTAPVVTIEQTKAVDAADAVTALSQGYLLAGHRDGQAWVEGRNANGALQWSKTVLSAKVVRVGALAALPSGEWAIAIDVQSATDGQKSAVTMRFAANGQLAWQSPPASDTVLRAMALVGPKTLTVGGQPPPWFSAPHALWRSLNSAGTALSSMGFGEGTAVQLLGSDGDWQMGVLRIGKVASDWRAQVYATPALVALPSAFGSAPVLVAVVLPNGSGEQFSMLRRENGWDVAAGAGRTASQGLQGQLFAWQIARTRVDGSTHCP